MINITIMGEPVAKGRPRFARCGRYTKTYTPEKTENYENLVKLIFQNLYPEFDLMIGALRMDVSAYFSIPKSTSKKQMADMLAGVLRPTKKPDRDNIEKIIGDALNGLAYKDDSQIVEGETRKFYSTNPRVEIKIRKL